jgi:hypothetical protein
MPNEIVKDASDTNTAKYLQVGRRGVPAKASARNFEMHSGEKLQWLIDHCVSPKARCWYSAARIRRGRLPTG